MKVASKTKTPKAKTTTPAPASRQTAATLPVARNAAASVANRTVAIENIAARAYTLWEQAGRPQGRDVEYWLEAEAQLNNGSRSFSA